MHFVVVWITLYETLFVDKQSISRYKHNMKEDVKKYLGLKVRAIREAAGMTQEELAATCDVSWRTISNLERGIRSAECLSADQSLVFPESTHISEPVCIL